MSSQLAYRNELTARLREQFAAGEIQKPHGSRNTYEVYGCRCPECAEVEKSYRKAQYGLRLAEPYRDCIIEGCERGAAPKRRRCRAHDNRAVRYGDAGSPETRTNGTGDIGYDAAHSRVKSMHGPASNHQCRHCEDVAHDWAYVHGSPAERFEPDPRGHLMPYSPNPDDYMPLCRTCHRAYDKRT